MKKKGLLWGILLLVVIVIALAIYPTIEINKDGKLIVFRYSDDFTEFETNSSYNERYFYNEERDISIYSFDVENYLFFYVITMEYVEGDARKTEFVLEESYIQNFLDNATIEDNADNINIAALIDGKEAIVGNTRYLGNDYETCISYILDGKHEILYVFYVDDLLVIQVGFSDEGPRFIAYQ